MMKTKALLLSVDSFFILVLALAIASAQSSKETEGRAAEQAGRLREALTHYIAALQSVSEGSADDQRLRETIIKLVQKLSPPPAVPEEARRFSVRGQTWINEAKNPSDLEEAAKEFARAVRVAPWWADGYINHGVALEKAGKFSEAIRSLKLYLLAAPAAPDADKVKGQIYALEVRQEKAAQEKAARDDVAQRQREEQLRAQRWLDSINGARFTFQDGPWPGSSMRFVHTIDIRGQQVVVGQIAYYGSDVQFTYPSGVWHETKRATLLQGREYVDPDGYRGTISEDGNSVHVVQKRGSITYRRQR